MNNRIGVYVCQCGSNISDYIDVEKVRAEVAETDGVVLARTTMFACSDATQKEIVQDIQNNELDAIVIASCSPKLHLFTFREVANRAGLNPYRYVQVNIREQGSWAHSDNPEMATFKAIHQVKAGIARAKLSQTLTRLRITSVNTALVIGAGMAGMKAALELADMGTRVFLIERDHFVGGRTSQWSSLFTTFETGEEVVLRVYREVDSNPNITLLTGAELVSVKGTVGNFEATIKITPRYIKPGCDMKQYPELEAALKKAIDACPVEVPDEFNFNITKRKAIYNAFKSEFPQCPAIDHEHCTRCGECLKYFDHIDLEQKEETLSVQVGAILVATGFDPYEPAEGEYGYHELANVITLPQFKRLIEIDEKELVYKGRPIHTIAYIYCVGSRQTEGPNKHCSRYCCTSAIHAAIHANRKYHGIQNIHFNRGIRTYGKQETFYSESLEAGDIFVQFLEEEPPVVFSENGKTIVRVNDILTRQKEVEAEADLVVLVTGMVPRKNSNIGELLKIPTGRDHFFNEVHPKLKPVETVIDGVFICGACQAPFNITESVKSALSASSKANALISKGYIELDPLLAEVNQEVCVWCDSCAKACPFDAISKISFDGKQIASVDHSKCKGCGMCLPVCNVDAIGLTGYSDHEIESMIDQMIG
ncbi:MAG: CoB--CoM heterodisulfide reductase iron-sulfur subunit A family protein [Bacteroidales bacterium]|nr:CoB--CoM heterodisulfide reductase iron-sulfur subunit A family protein [Bacteroidales bacterium]